MKRETSLYLDLVRFSAAFIVFLEHLREHTRNSFSVFWHAHPFWYSHLDAFSETAVIVFFVLSGYVIAHVLATREHTFADFATSRLARLYSVAIPALLLTAATNYAEALRYPTAFHSYENVPAALRYAGTGLFVSHFWLWPDLEPANAPFWSISYEVAYYAGIAIFLFATGYARYIGLALLTLAAGPTMVLLAPTWLAGYWTYHLSKRRLNEGLGVALWLLSTVLLASCFAVEERFRLPLPFLRMPDATVGGLLAAYAVATCFVLNLLAFNACPDSMTRVFKPVSGVIRWCGSMTFALYLFHQPLLSFLTVYPIGARSSATQIVALIGIPLLFVATAGRFCEASKGAYKRFFTAIWNRSSVMLPLVNARAR